MIPALLIAAGGAVLIALIMVALPARRGPDPLTSTAVATPPQPGPFRVTEAPRTPIVPEPEPETEPVAAVPAPPERARPAAPADTAVAPDPSAPSVVDLDVPRIAVDLGRAPSATDPSPVPLGSDTPAGATAVVAPPRPAASAPAEPEAATAAAPDLLEAFMPATVLERPRPEPTGLRAAARALEPDLDAAPGDARAMLRDHSLAVPIAAVLVVGVAAFALRRSRRR